MWNGFDPPCMEISTLFVFEPFPYICTCNIHVIHPGLDTSVHHNWNALIECDKYKNVYTFLISYNTEGGWRTNDGYQALRPNPACAPCPVPEVAKR